MNSLFGKISKEELLELLVHNTPVAYIILDEDFRIHFMNDFFLSLRDLDNQQVLGETCYNISNGGNPCQNCAVQQVFATGKKALVTRMDVMPSGAVRYIDDYAFPLHTDKTGRRYALEIMVDRSEEMAARQARDGEYHEILSILTSLIDAKDTYTAAHSSNVQVYAKQLASAMALGERECFEVSVAATLHDIGKVRIPEEILTKPGPLTNEEYTLIKTHAVHSYDMLQGFASLAGIRRAVRHHHERWDGTGYPDTLAGEAIPLASRIIAVADTYDAITSSRSYQAARSHEEALREICRVAGTQLDPAITKVFAEQNFENETSGQRGHLVKRTVTTRRAKSPEDFVCFHQLGDELLGFLLPKVLDYTPCGYAIVDTHFQTLYASPYFLAYLGTSEEELLGHCCHMAMDGRADPCASCLMQSVMKTGQAAHSRITRDTKNGWRSFELHGLPLKSENGKVEYVIVMTLDHTEEDSLDRQRGIDFQKLIAMLDGLLEEQEGSHRLDEQINRLRCRLDTLLAKSLA